MVEHAPDGGLARCTGAVLTGAEAPVAVEQQHLTWDLSAPSQGRTVVRSFLSSHDRGDWIDPVTLACTELISNVVLHAHTDAELTLTLHADRLHVQVRDFSPVIPLPRRYEPEATTGRGLGLVAAVSDEHGIVPHGSTGKTVWFVIRDRRSSLSSHAHRQGTAHDGSSRTADSIQAWVQAWNLDELINDDLDLGSGSADVGCTDTGSTDSGSTDVSSAASGAAPSAPCTTYTVVLLNLPPTLWLAAREHHDALLRELVLYQAEHGTLSVDLAAADRARQAISSRVAIAVEHALQQGADVPGLPAGHPSPLPPTPSHLDLHVTVPVTAPADYVAMQDALDAGEELAAAGRLLARPGLPEVVAVRDWACEQFIAQAAGVPPVAWAGAAHDRFTRDQTTGNVGAAELAPFRASTHDVIVVDEANRILMISDSLASELGWSSEQLVGRRVVTLIPPALREAHVAGFTRHLATGQAYALDTDLTLPMLHRHGQEVLRSFHIRRATTDSGRAVYVARIGPVTA